MWPYYMTVGIYDYRCLGKYLHPDDGRQPDDGWTADVDSAFPLVTGAAHTVVRPAPTLVAQVAAVTKPFPRYGCGG
jgi:hypothetical protein